MNRTRRRATRPRRRARRAASRASGGRVRVRHGRIVARESRSLDSGAGGVAFLIGCRLDPEQGSRSVCVGRTRKVLSLPPSTGGADWAGASGLSLSWRTTRRRRGAADACVGRLRRSLTHPEVRSLSCSPPAFASTTHGANSRYRRRVSVERRCRSLCQNRGDGTHLVRTHVRPASRQGRRRRDRPVPVGRRADRARDHRRHRHLQPPRRPPAPESQGQALAGRPDAAALQPRRRLRARRTGRVRGQGGPGHRRPDLSRRRPRGRGGQAGRVRHRARRPAHDPPRRHRPPADRRRSSATSARSTSRACRSAAPCRRRGPPRSWPSSTRTSSSRCRSATTRPTAPRP